MNEEIVILLAEDNLGHAALIRKNLKRSGLVSEVIHFQDGEKVLKFLFAKNGSAKLLPGKKYILLLDINMPVINGIEVLKKVKDDPILRNIPIIMVTTTDDPKDIEQCYRLGCNSYITKPVESNRFSDVIQTIGQYLSSVQLPPMQKL